MLNLIKNKEVWKTPSIDKNGFVFEVQVLDYKPYDVDIVKKSIKNLEIGESREIPYNATADEWANTFYFCEKGFENNIPQTRQEALDILEKFLHEYYIKGKEHPWKSTKGHLTYHHYAAEFGFDIIGSEIGCLVKGYQMTLAFNRGAARQYAKPWYVDVSPWFDDYGMLDYSGEAIWGYASGDTFGHSLSLFRRSYFMSYISGASWIIAEAGGINFFYPQLDDNGNYKISPLGEVGKEFNDFAKTNPDIGIPYTPFGIMLDYYHGTNYGSLHRKKAFEIFPYNDGDNMSWSIIDKFFPGSWFTWYRPETGFLTNSPYGDTCDIILQNAPEQVINSYPAIILSGDINFNVEESAKILKYVIQGGTLVINSAYLRFFPEFIIKDSNRENITFENGRVIVYGPDFCTDLFDDILADLTEELVPFSISGKVEYLINVKNDSIILTVINNEGVKKESRGLAIIDESKRQTVDIVFKGKSTVKWVKNLLNNEMLKTDFKQSLLIEPGDLAIIEFGF